jgi:hypothetical protein
MKKSIHDEIARIAYELYVKEGSVHGNDLKNWFEAENIVMEKKGKHAREITSGAEPVNKPSTGYRRTVKKEGFYKKA